MYSEKSYYPVTEHLLISLLVGRPVKFWHKDHGTKVTQFVGIINARERIYQFNDFDHRFSAPYIVENCHIHYLDYDWSAEDIQDKLCNMHKLKVKSIYKGLYDRFKNKLKIFGVDFR